MTAHAKPQAATFFGRPLYADGHMFGIGWADENFSTVPRSRPVGVFESALRKFRGVGWHAMLFVAGLPARGVQAADPHKALRALEKETRQLLDELRVLVGEEE